MTDPGALIVTGAGRGIGAAVARLAGAHGYAVAINWVASEAPALALAHEIVAAGGRAIAIQGDVAEEADVKRLFERAETALGPLRALVNNAGITGGFARADAIEAGARRPHARDQRHGHDPVQPRGGSAPVDAAWRLRRRHR